MTILRLTVELSEDIAKKARDFGILDQVNLANLIEAEVIRKRQEAGQRLLSIMDSVSEQFKADYAHLTDEEQEKLVNDWINEAGEIPQVDRIS